ncbi:MAG: hypothetical protein KZY61_03435 [Clostridiaceae bacterium]|nr:hypothetical protein [Clostridiaceae bacterium]MBW4861089.1 hypothetical protein [Clostridiaceae bacterium]MBW4867714.1 hypothetical protein [Clostridiaceae bacterium]
MDTKLIILGSFMAIIAFIFQVIPVLFSEVFVFVTVLSGIPIYISARKKPVIGFLTYIVADVLVALLSVHEGFFFFFTNGIVGLSLGISNFYIKKSIINGIIGGIILTISLSIMTFIFGINIFGKELSFHILIQLIILAIFSLFYCLIYDRFSDFVFNKINGKM